MLSRVPVFAGVDRERLAGIAAASTVREYAAGAVVVLRGTPCAHLIVVENGALTAVHDTAGGQRRRLGDFPAPCAVDKAALLGRREYTATWITARRSRLRFVPAEHLFAVLDEVPAARAHVLRHLADQVREQQELVALAGFADTTTRVAAWLVRAAGSGSEHVVLPGAQQGLADAVGASRVSVNRALRALAGDGLIRVRPGTVTLLAPELLAARASGSG